MNDAVPAREQILGRQGQFLPGDAKCVARFNEATDAEIRGCREDAYDYVLPTEPRADPRCPIKQVDPLQQGWPNHVGASQTVGAWDVPVVPRLRHQPADIFDITASAIPDKWPPTDRE